MKRNCIDESGQEYPSSQARTDKNAPLLEVLRALIRRQINISFIPEYQATATTEEGLGLLVSKFLQWDGVAIMKAMYSALEDANFHAEADEIAKMIERAERGNSMKTQTHTPTLEARLKIWKGNRAGFRIFQDGVKVIEHVNALREDEAIERAKEILAKRESANLAAGSPDVISTPTHTPAEGK